MTFLSSLDICAFGVSAQRVRMDIAAENIAHVNTARIEAGGPHWRKDVLFESFGVGSFREAVRGTAMGNGFVSRHAGVRIPGIIEDGREMERVYNPGRPDADAEGYVNMPNVDLLRETVGNMSAAKSYEVNVTASNAIKLTAQKVSDIGR